MLQIRGHHLLCIACGFDKLDTLEPPEARGILDRDERIKVTMQCDIICHECPWEKKGICSKHPGSDAEVREMDRLVLRKLNLQEEEETSEAFSLLRKLMNPEDVYEICLGRHHDWPVEECAEGLRKFKESRRIAEQTASNTFGDLSPKVA